MTKHNPIIELHHAVMPMSKIIKQLKVPKSKVYRGCKKSLGTQNIVPKADAHAVPKATSTLFEIGKGGTQNAP